MEVLHNESSFYFWLSVSQSVRLFAYLSIYLSVYLYAYLSIYLSICLPTPIYSLVCMYIFFDLVVYFLVWISAFISLDSYDNLSVQQIYY